MRPRPAPCSPALLPGRPPSGRWDPHSGLGPPLAARWGAWLKGGPACGKRRHGRSCSVNESKCLGDRGLPGGRHAKGGGGGGGKRAGEGGGGKKSQSCSNSVSSTLDVHQPGRGRSKGFETDRGLAGGGGQAACGILLEKRRVRFHRDFGGLVGCFFIIIIFQFLNPA